MTRNFRLQICESLIRYLYWDVYRGHRDIISCKQALKDAGA